MRLVAAAGVTCRCRPDAAPLRICPETADAHGAQNERGGEQLAWARVLGGGGRATDAHCPSPCQVTRRGALRGARRDGGRGQGWRKERAMPEGSIDRWCGCRPGLVGWLAGAHRALRRATDGGNSPAPARGAAAAAPARRSPRRAYPRACVRSGCPLYSEGG
eukprot:scaffold937_cov502-Prasinococcus_capsulatus_cf.AAC.6